MLFLTIIPGCVSSLFFSVYNNSQWYFCNPLANNPHDGDISQNIYSQKLSTSQPMKPQPMISWPLMHWSISMTTFQTYLYHNHQNQLQPSNAVILPLDQTETTRVASLPLDQTEHTRVSSLPLDQILNPRSSCTASGSKWSLQYSSSTSSSTTFPWSSCNYLWWQSHHSSSHSNSTSFTISSF